VTQEPRPRQADEIFCPTCGTLIKRAFKFCVNCGAAVPDLGAMPGILTTGPIPTEEWPYPLRFDVEYPESLSRLSTAFRLILAIPQLLIVYALGTVVGLVTFISWFAILFTKRYPKGLFDLVVSFNRWSANVYAYIALLRDEYPPFSTDPGRYAVVYDVAYPETLNRWLIFVKWLLVVPHQIVLGVLGLLAGVFGMIAWFAILFTGRFPRGLFDYIAGLLRWYLRVSAYSGLLTDKFPPYSGRADAGPASGRAIAWSAVLAPFALAAYVGVYLAIFALSIGSFTETHEVDLTYREVVRGEFSPTVDVEGTQVTLLDAEDPATVPGFRRAASGHHLVTFELSIRNVDATFTTLSAGAFDLTDTGGNDHSPLLVDDRGVINYDQLARGQSAIVMVTFEIRNGRDPAELTYSPGFAAFLPFGERVRFVFR